MMKHYHIYTTKDGNKFIQTKSKYLAHALSYCRFQFMVFKDSNGNEFYSFEYSDELVNAIEHIIELRRSNIVENSN